MGEVEEIDVIDRAGNALPSFVWEELVTTGKQRVHAGFRVVVDIQGSIRESSVNYSRLDALRDLSKILKEDGYVMAVWGVEDGFYETGLSQGSGYGYFKFDDGTQTKAVRAIAKKISQQDRQNLVEIGLTQPPWTPTGYAAPAASSRKAFLS